MELATLVKEMQKLADKLTPKSATWGEEAAKQNLVLPLLKALGYDVFNSNEVDPELPADIGIKKGEKVDYAIKVNGDPVILVECKSVGTVLGNAELSQLYRYFSCRKEARVGILTNGVDYRFYTDLEAQNCLDYQPFHQFNLKRDSKEDIARFLQRFTKDNVHPDQIREFAQGVKDEKKVKDILSVELSTPSDDFVRLLAKKAGMGEDTKATAKCREMMERLLPRLITRPSSPALPSEPRDPFEPSVPPMQPMPPMPEPTKGQLCKMVLPKYGVTAYCRKEAENRWVVLAGCMILEGNKDFLAGSPGLTSLRRKAHIGSDGRLMKDVPCTSSSQAAAFVRGRSSDGPRYWNPVEPGTVVMDNQPTPTESRPSPMKRTYERELDYIAPNGARFSGIARCMETDDGHWIVPAGSFISPKKDGSLRTSLLQLRAATRLDAHGCLLESITFKSKSTAASFVAGTSQNGSFWEKRRLSGLSSLPS